MIQSFNKYRRHTLLLITVGLTGCSTFAKSNDMIDIKKHFKSFLELEYLARALNEFPIGGPAQSLPVPVRRQDQLMIAYMVHAQMAMPGPLIMWPPREIIWLDPVNGKLIEKTNVTPADFGQTDPADEILKVKPSEYSRLTYDEFAALEKRLYILYDILFPAWATGSSTLSQVQLQNFAHEALDIFYKISKQPLQPYYESLGRDWFSWLRKLAG